ncbi:hypothetical protein EJB05_04305 [Eragrostis curvula]|uniref:F-box domain-containing protein n=1 Tax=Eragrostis curvula TaxID=38414 RepID=A0A5J9WC00_9POAL|nr:hypothetical protein EJB05_04305 [Eragrostis curvula]
MIDDTRYQADIWSVIAKYLNGFDLLMLSFTCSWFREFLSEDSIWRDAFLRHVHLPGNSTQPPRRLHGSWRNLYFANIGLHEPYHAYSFRQSKKLNRVWRIGAFCMESSDMLLTVTLPLPMSQQHTYSVKMGICNLNNARRGIWIAEMCEVQCGACENCGVPVIDARICPCSWMAGHMLDRSAVLQVFDARHCELFQEKAYLDGSMVFEDVGEHVADKDVAAAFCAAFDSQRLASSPTTILMSKAWVRDRDDMQPETFATTYAAAVHTNLQQNYGK